MVSNFNGTRLARPPAGKTQGISMQSTMKPLIIKLQAGLLLLAAVLMAPLSNGYAQSASQPEALYNEMIPLGTADNPYISEVVVAAGKAVVLRFDQGVEEVLVGDSNVADILPLTNRSLYVLGRSTGSTSLTILNSSRQMVGTINLQVSVDLLPIKLRLHELFPNENIEIRSIGRSVMLSGEVTSSAVSNTAYQIAESYAPGLILNNVAIGQPQQVMLEVRIAEISRTAARDLGLRLDAFTDFGDDMLERITTGIINPEATAVLRGGFEEGSWSVDAILDALEERGVVSILAEPTLMALSGQSASFLAGGEFPVPVGRGRGGNDDDVEIQIEFKEFGVRLSFTPTVIGEDINLLVEPEVSELDRASGIVVSDLVIPGISTRRASTTVELRHGQSFAIAGLISETFSDQIQETPGLARLPILGAIGRSTSMSREETELAIIVTPYLVTPSTPGQLSDPVRDFVRPSTLEMFFLGRTEVPSSQQSYFWQRPVEERPRSSGIDGSAGYVLE